MPQDSMLSQDPRHTGITISIQEVEATQGQDWNVTVRRHTHPSSVTTVHVSRWSGYMLDFIATFCQEVGSAFMFGDDRDLARSAAHVVKNARAHARRHDRVGSS